MKLLRRGSGPCPWATHCATGAAFHRSFQARADLGCKRHQVLRDKPPCSRLSSNLETISKGLSKPFGDWQVKMGKEQPNCALVESASLAKSRTHTNAAPKQAGAKHSSANISSEKTIHRHWKTPRYIEEGNTVTSGALFISFLALCSTSRMYYFCFTAKPSRNCTTEGRSRTSKDSASR